MIFKVNKKVEAPAEGLKESINKFYDVEGDAILGVSTVVDIQEWDPNGAAWVDDVAALRVYKDSVYILQVLETQFYLKVLTPAATYIYHLESIPLINWYGMVRPYSSFEILDENTVIYGPLYIDLENLLAFIYDEFSIFTSGVAFRYINYIPYVSSVKKINATTWIYSYIKYKPSFGYAIQVNLYQKTSFLDCMGCENRKKILEAIGAQKRLNDIECTDEEIATVRGMMFPKKEKVLNKDLEGGYSIYRGMNKRAQEIKTKFDSEKCLEMFNKISKILNRTSISSTAVDYNKSLTKYCSPEMLKVFVPYIEVLYKTKHLKETFLKNYYNGNIDYDEFYSDLSNVGKSILFMLAELNTAIDDYFKMINILKSLFETKYILLTVWIYISWDQFKDKYYDTNKNEWIKKFNPFKEAKKISYDDLINDILTYVSSMPLPNQSPFKLRRIKITSKKNFNLNGEYISLGPAGCFSKKEITGDSIKEDKFGYICDTELRFDDILLWVYKDVNENRYVLSSFVYFEPIYDLKLYKYNLKKGTLKMVDSIEVRDDWFMMPNRKMAVKVTEEEMYIRDFYFDGEKIQYVEYKKPYLKEYKKIFSSTGSFVQTNINVVTDGLGANSPVPGFPNAYVGGEKYGRSIFWWDMQWYV